MNENEVKERLKDIDQENEYSFIHLLSIPRNVVDELFIGENIREQERRMVKLLDESLQIIPLWGGGMDSDAEYQYLLVFRNKKLKLEVSSIEYKPKFMIRKRD